MPAGGGGRDPNDRQGQHSEHQLQYHPSAADQAL
jgi:hypothetical protein